MKLFRKIFQKQHSAVLVFDGEHWHAGMFAQNRHAWIPRESLTIASRSLKQIPTQIIEFLIAQRASTVRILIPADLHSMPIELPMDADKEEMHTAIAYEIAEEIGKDAHLLRLATVEAALYAMGCEAGVYLTSGFESQQLESYRRELKQVGIGFSGIGALELGLLALHAEHPQDRLLLLRHKSGFYVVPGSEEQPFYMTSVQTGLIPETTEREQERLQRLQRQLQMHHDFPIRVVTATTDGIAAADRVRDVLSQEEPASITALDSVMERLMMAALSARIGDTQSTCPLIGPPPPPRDPHRAGTWLCLLITGMTLMYVTSRIWHLHQEWTDEQERAQVWKAITEERKKTADACAALRQARNEQSAVFNALTSTNRLPEGFLAIMDTLGRRMPPYTRITSIIQSGADQFELSGTTRWNKGKVQLDRILSESLDPEGLIAVPGAMQFHEEAREQHFVYHIEPLGRTP